MSRPSPSSRLLQLGSLPGLSHCLLTQLSGHDAISSPFEFELTLMGAKDAVDPAQVLGQSVSWQVNHTRNQPQYFNGCISKFSFEIGEHGKLIYHITARPWLWFLSEVKDCRAFTKLSTVGIVKKLLTEHGFHDFDISKLTGQYAKRDYCVQFNETTLDFIQRLLAEEGIFYYFVHDNNKHTLVLADSVQAYQPYPKNINFNANDAASTHYLKDWYAGQNSVCQQAACQDYNFISPDKDLSSAGKGPSQAKAGLVGKPIEHYQYPGEYQTTQDGQQRVKLKNEQLTRDELIYSGTANYPNFTPATQLQFADNAAPKCCITKVEYRGQDLSGTTTHQREPGEGRQSFETTFHAISADKTFRPTPIKKPLVRGVHLATVCNGQGSDIQCDKYGRIKVHFPWDREHGASQATTTWLRANQLLSGANWGSSFIPRKGTELMISYENGDPDKPMAIACLYNSDMRLPYDTKTKLTQSGIKTETLQQHDNSQRNELRFDDKPGEEQLYLRAQKDLNREVKHNLIETINHNYNATIKRGDQHVKINEAECVIEAKDICLQANGAQIIIDQTGIHFDASQININVLGGDSVPLSRVGDHHKCTKKHRDLTSHKGGPIKQGSPNVFINGKAAARLGDKAKCSHNTKDHITHGINMLLINGQPAAAKGKKTAHKGKIKQGSPNVSGGMMVGAPRLSPATPVKQFAAHLDYFHLENMKELSGAGITSMHEDPKDNKPEQVAQNSHWRVTNDEGHAVFPTGKTKVIEAHNREILKVNDTKIVYPHSLVEVKGSDLKPDSQYQKKIALKAIMPPVIVNVRPKPHDANSRQKLTDFELEYFKKNGNNALIFIHGYNVPYGAFPKQVIGAAEQPEQVIATPVGFESDPVSTMTTPIFSDSDRTLFRNNDMLDKRYPNLSQLNDETLNGTDAHNWMLHMEDNLNMATGQFDRSDYSKFQRCINVAWYGDYGSLHYLDADPSANAAGKKLPPLINQLHDAGIEINIIAHSLGNRVLLSMMNELGKAGKSDIIKHVFMWEPAVPQTALSPDPEMDVSLDQDSNFSKAYIAAEKITVLYSKNDSIVNLPYLLAVNTGISHNGTYFNLKDAEKGEHEGATAGAMAGFSAGSLPGTIAGALGGALVGFVSGTPAATLIDNSNKHSALVQQRVQEVMKHYSNDANIYKDLGVVYDPSNPEQSEQRLNAKLNEMTKELEAKYQIPCAMGHAGIDTITLQTFPNQMESIPNIMGNQFMSMFFQVP